MGNSSVPKESYSNLMSSNYMTSDRKKILILGENHDSVNDSYAEYLFSNKSYFNGWNCFTEAPSLINNGSSMNDNKYKEIFSAITPKDVIRHSSYMVDINNILTQLVFKTDEPVYRHAGKTFEQTASMMTKEKILKLLGIIEKFYTVFLSMDEEKKFNNARNSLYEQLFEVKEFYTNKNRQQIGAETQNTMAVLQDIFVGLKQNGLSEKVSELMSNYSDIPIVIDVIKHVINNNFPGKFNLVDKKNTLKYERDPSGIQYTIVTKSNGQELKIESGKISSVLLCSYLYDMYVFASALFEKPDNLLILCGMDHVKNITHLFTFIGFKTTALMKDNNVSNYYGEIKQFYKGGALSSSLLILIIIVSLILLVFYMNQASNPKKSVAERWF